MRRAICVHTVKVYPPHNVLYVPAINMVEQAIGNERESGCGSERVKSSTDAYVLLPMYLHVMPVLYVCMVQYVVYRTPGAGTGTSTARLVVTTTHHGFMFLFTLYYLYCESSSYFHANLCQCVTPPKAWKRQVFTLPEKCIISESDLIPQ